MTTKAKLGADIALAVIGICFVAPLLWLLLAAVDPQAGYQTKVPLRLPPRTSVR